jgi:hypothetical protein
MTVQTEGEIFEPLIPMLDTGSFGNPYFRFTLLYGLIILTLSTLPIWLAFLSPEFVSLVNVHFILLFSLIWIFIGINASLNFNRLGSVELPTLQDINATRTRKFTHSVIVPCYLDPIDVLFDCLGSLMLQHDPMALFVVVAFESKTPDLLVKEAAVRKAFSNKFGEFLITIHTVQDNEIPGGCSNKNYALREMYKQVTTIRKLYNTSITLTTCDTDSLFHPNYFNVLEMCYNNENPDINIVNPRMCVWQPALFYNWDLDQRPFFNRITGIMRSLMMLGGLISFDLNPMSIFSYPLELGLKVGFINPRYGVDDIIAKVRWMCETNESVPVLLLPVPCISGNYYL